MTRDTCAVCGGSVEECGLQFVFVWTDCSSGNMRVQHEITFTAAHEAVCVFVVSPEHGCAGKSSQCDISTDDSGV